MIYEYAQTVNAGKLIDEIIAAIPELAPDTSGTLPVARFTVSSGPGHCRIEGPAGLGAELDAVLAAHTTTPSPSQAAAAARDRDDRSALSSLAGTYAAMLDKLNDIQADMTVIRGRADTLSTVNVGGTLAQTQAQLQNILRALGGDLGAIAEDVAALSVGLERQLKALATVRRLAIGGFPHDDPPLEG